MRGGTPISPHDAMLEASTIRFRPIMMTSLAAILGTLPIRARLRRRSRGAAAAGHRRRRRLLFSQLLTLYITPAFFLTMERLLTRKAQETK